VKKHVLRAYSYVQIYKRIFYVDQIELARRLEIFSFLVFLYCMLLVLVHTVEATIGIVQKMKKALHSYARKCILIFPGKEIADKLR
jgi:hypothetical protein